MPESMTALKVLVAEDEPAMLSLVARHIRSLGFSVVEASEGDVAWELAQQHRPDLVILDVMMPGMSGWEICKRLKAPSADGAFAKTAVIMLTGIGENLNEMTSALFAADAWLNKPFDFNDLDAKIRETLKRYAKNATSSSAQAADDPGKGAGKKATLARAAKKPAAKKAVAAKKPVAKKAAAAKKPVAKKAATKKPVTKKAATKKPAAKKPVTKKAAAKKPAAKEAVAKVR
jgi:DNA-binding response OmpR family regulator